MKKNLFQSLMPYIAAIIIFLLATFLLFTPLFQGERLVQGDITNFKGMSKEIQDYRAKTGEEPLWTNSMFGGMPAYQISVKYKNNLFSYVDKIFRLGLPRPADYVFLYFIGFFFLLVVMGVNPWLAIIGALAYGFSSYFIIILEAGHNSKAHAIAYMAPLLGSILLTLKGKWLKGGILTAIFACLELYANHLQITYYFLILVLIVWIAFLVDSIQKKQIVSMAKATGVLIIAAFLAILPNFTQLWTTWEYSKETTRGKTELSHQKEIQTRGLDKEYVTQWSYGVSETWSLMIPNVKGGATDQLGKSEFALEKLEPSMRRAIAQQNHYWGDQPFTSGPVYVGAIIVFLFILGIFIVDGALKWGLVAATALSIMLAWGKNFMPLTDFFLDYVPLYDKFRAVSMILVIAEVCMPLLGILALEKIYQHPSLTKNEASSFRKKFFIAYGLTGGISLIFYMFPNLFFNFISSAERSQLNELRSQVADPSQIALFIQSLETSRIAIFRHDAIRSFLFITIAAGVIYAYASKLRFPRPLFLISMGLLIFIDLYVINKRYVTEDKFESSRMVDSPFTPTPADQLILKDTDIHYRVLNLSTNTFNDAITSYFHKSIGGYHGAKLKRYQELIDHQISKNNMEVLNMLNTKYFIVPDENRKPSVRINMSALGNAWFPKEYQLVKNADEEMEALNHFKAAETAIIDQRFAKYLEGYQSLPDSMATIELKEYAPNRLVYHSKTTTDRLAVFSEIYYPYGWQAYVDGKPQAHFRANYVLRAMIVPSGEHEIIFKFEPQSYYMGEKISLAGSILLLLMLAGMIAQEIKKYFVSKRRNTLS